MKEHPKFNADNFIEGVFEAETARVNAETEKNELEAFGIAKVALNRYFVGGQASTMKKEVKGEIKKYPQIINRVIKVIQDEIEKDLQPTNKITILKEFNNYLDKLQKQN
jgi:hypothetical protein